MAYNLIASAQTAVTLQIQLFTVIVIQIFGGFVYTVGVICITFVVYLKLDSEETVFVAITEEYRTWLIRIFVYDIFDTTVFIPNTIDTEVFVCTRAVFKFACWKNIVTLFANLIIFGATFADRTTQITAPIAVACVILVTASALKKAVCIQTVGANVSLVISAIIHYRQVIVKLN